MRILARYVALALLRGYSIVLLILVSLFSFFALVHRLDEIGNPDYGIVDAVFYVALTLPQRILDLAPVTAFLGGLLGLGMLARGNELVVMLTSGVSLHRFAWFVGKPAIILSVGCALFSQFVAPPMTQLAEKSRMNATARGTSTVKRNGFWSRDSHQVLHVRDMWNGQIPYQLELYEFSPQGGLARYVHAERANILDGQHWELVNVRRKVFDGTAIIRENREKLRWQSFLGRQQLKALRLPAKSLSPLSLYQYIQYRKGLGQTTARFELVFWQKLFLPLNVGLMAMLALPLGLTLTRSNQTVQRLALGASIGIMAFLFNRIITNLGLITGGSPSVVNALPVAALAGLAGFLLWRVARKGGISAFGPRRTNGIKSP